MRIHDRLNRRGMTISELKKAMGDDWSRAGIMGLESIGSVLTYLMFLAGASLLIYQLFGTSKLAEMQQSVASMRMNIQQMYTSSLDYTGLENSIAIKAGLIPKKLVKGGAIVNSWGGTVTVATGDDAGTFTITVGAVPQEECTKLATFQIDSWLEVEVNSTQIGRDTGIAEAAGNCQASNTIIYTAR